MKRLEVAIGVFRPPFGQSRKCMQYLIWHFGWETAKNGSGSPNSPKSQPKLLLLIQNYNYQRAQGEPQIGMSQSAE